MKFLLPLLFMFLLYESTHAAINTPTNRQVFNFSVGDTFVYSFYYLCDPVNYCTRYYRIVVTAKSFSAGGDTLCYTFQGSVPHISNVYTNLDSVVIYPDIQLNPRFVTDTTYVDSTSYCTPLLVADSATAPGGLSDYFGYKYVVGLGNVESYYVPIQGSLPGEGYRLDLVYYHKGNVSCGSYDPASIASSIEPLTISKSIQVFPNPATDKLNIEVLPAIEPYSIFDATGRVCQTGLCQHEIGINSLAKGIYFIRVSTATTAAFTRFVKQ